jgi:hypothetical protein
MRIPSLANTASNMPVNLLSRSRIKNLNSAARSPRSIRKVACLLGHPGATGVGGDSEDIGATGRVFYHE